MRGNPKQFTKIGNFKCDCGKEFLKSSSLYAHQSHCKIHLGDRYNDKKHFDRFGAKRVWSKGKTCDDAIYGESIKRISKASQLRLSNPENNPLTKWNKNKPKEAYKKQSETRKEKSLQGTLFQDEDTFEKLLLKYKIIYKRHFSIKRSHRSWYVLDFLIDDKINLEIDGKSHLYEPQKTTDIKRDNTLKSLGYIVYRINVYNSPKTFEELFLEFLEWYHSLN